MMLYALQHSKVVMPLVTDLVMTLMVALKLPVAVLVLTNHGPW